jgi:hypothetical protein
LGATSPARTKANLIEFVREVKEDIQASDLSVTALEAETCEYTNLVISYPTAAFLD